MQLVFYTYFMNLHTSISTWWRFGVWGTLGDMSALNPFSSKGGLWTFSANLALCAAVRWRHDGGGAASAVNQGTKTNGWCMASLGTSHNPVRPNVPPFLFTLIWLVITLICLLSLVIGNSNVYAFLVLPALTNPSQTFLGGGDWTEIWHKSSNQSGGQHMDRIL